MSIDPNALRKVRIYRVAIVGGVVLAAAIVALPCRRHGPITAPKAMCRTVEDHRILPVSSPPT